MPVCSPSLSKILNRLAVSYTWKMTRNAPDSMRAAARTMSPEIRFSCKREYECLVSKDAGVLPTWTRSCTLHLFLCRTYNNTCICTAKLDQYIATVFLLVFFWLHGMWNLSSPTRDQTRDPCSGSVES